MGVVMGAVSVAAPPTSTLNTMAEEKMSRGRARERRGEGGKKKDKGVFVTVGSTQFDELIKAASSEPFRQVNHTTLLRSGI